MKKISEKKSSTVEIQKYGGILTTFKTVEHYQMTDNINLGLVKDLVNEDVIQLVVYRSSKNAVNLNEVAAEVGMAAADLQKKDEEYLGNAIGDAWENAKSEKSSRFLPIEDMMIIVQDYEDTGKAFFIAPLGIAGDSPYYWPQ